MLLVSSHPCWTYPCPRLRPSWVLWQWSRIPLGSRNTDYNLLRVGVCINSHIVHLLASVSDVGKGSSVIHRNSIARKTLLLCLGAVFLVCVNNRILSLKARECVIWLVKFQLIASQIWPSGQLSSAFPVENQSGNTNCIKTNIEIEIKIKIDGDWLHLHLIWLQIQVEVVVKDRVWFSVWCEIDETVLFSMIKKHPWAKVIFLHHNCCQYNILGHWRGLNSNLILEDWIPRLFWRSEWLCNWILFHSIIAVLFGIKWPFRNSFHMDVTDIHILICNHHMNWSPAGVESLNSTIGVVSTNSQNLEGCYTFKLYLVMLRSLPYKIYHHIRCYITSTLCVFICISWTFICYYTNHTWMILLHFETLSFFMPVSGFLIHATEQAGRNESYSINILKVGHQFVVNVS